jgi:hypothetical protein
LQKGPTLNRFLFEGCVLRKAGTEVFSISLMRCQTLGVGQLNPMRHVSSLAKMLTWALQRDRNRPGCNMSA